MTDVSTDRPSRIPWPPVLLVGTIVAALAMDRAVLPLPVPFAEVGLINYMGMVLLVAGLALVLWAMIEFGRHRTSIRPDRSSEALVLVGPFAFSRNPIYLGETLALLGAGISYNSFWLFLASPVFAALVSHLAIRREEAYLERRFGAAYADYKSRVRRWI